VSARHRSLVRRGLCAAVLTLGALLAATGIAGAHASLTASAPADGETLDSAPTALSLSFTEAPEPSLSEIRVLDASGNPVPVESPAPTAGDRRSLTVPLPSLDHGAYTVSWRVVSAVDGHATAGALTFGVGVAPTEPGHGDMDAAVHVSPPTSPVEVAGRWALLAGLVVLVGGAVTAVVVMGTVSATPRWYPATGWGLGAVGLALLAWAQVDAAQVDLGSFLPTSIGRWLVWRGAGLAVAGVGLVGMALSDGRARRIWLALSAIGGAGAVLAHVASGHAAVGGTFDLQVAAQWAHVTAVAVWIGGLAALLLSTRGEPNEARGRAVRRFSTAAGIALAAVVATGVVRALNQVGSLDGLFSTAYGRLVILKVLLLGGLATLGAVNRYRNVPRAERTLSGLRRVSKAELAMATAVLAATALLATISPPSSVHAVGAPRSGPRLVATGSDFATSVRVTLRVEPGLPGSNRFVARVVDFDSGEPIAADRVAVRLSFASGEPVESTVELQPAGEGVYEATSDALSVEGRWEVLVLVQEAADAVQVPLTIATPCRAESMTMHGAPTIHTIELASGATAQGYVDPGTAGPNQVHVTFFDAGGSELAAESIELVAWRPGVDPDDLEVDRLTMGHFVANQELDEGRWRVEFDAELGGEENARGCFEETIEAP
jgi:copper transport protein